ncbi:MAG TPA: VanZ family protein [Waterburya sp.]|jgi:hypothetical protein
MLQRNWVIAFAIYFLILLTIIALAYLGILPVKVGVIPFYDTIGHFILLGSASFLGHKALGGQMTKIGCFPFVLPLAPILVSIFAAVDETLQAFSPLRTSSLSDMTANLLGIWGFYYLAARKRRGK